jgi:hypothetical protein
LIDNKDEDGEKQNSLACRTWNGYVMASFYSFF